MSAFRITRTSLGYAACGALALAAAACPPSHPTGPPPSHSDTASINRMQEEYRQRRQSQAQLEIFEKEVAAGETAQSAVAKMNHPQLAWIAGTWCETERVDPVTGLVKDIYNYRVLADGSIQQTVLRNYKSRGIGAIAAIPTHWTHVRGVNRDVIELWHFEFSTDHTTKSVDRFERKTDRSFDRMPHTRYTKPGTALDTSYSTAGSKWERFGKAPTAYVRCPYKKS